MAVASVRRLRTAVSERITVLSSDDLGSRMGRPGQRLPAGQDRTRVGGVPHSGHEPLLGDALAGGHARAAALRRLVRGCLRRARPADRHPGAWRGDLAPCRGGGRHTGALAWLPAALCASVGGFLADQLAYWLARSWTTRRDERAPSRAGGRFARPAAMVR